METAPSSARATYLRLANSERRVREFSYLCGNTDTSLVVIGYTFEVCFGHFQRSINGAVQGGGTSSVPPRTPQSTHRHPAGAQTIAIKRPLDIKGARSMRTLHVPYVFQHVDNLLKAVDLDRDVRTTQLARSHL